MIRTLVFLAVGALVWSLPAPVMAGPIPDLAIGYDKKTDRPNAFIAWRNSQRILEVEVEVQNHGEAQASGRLVLAVLDENGRVLASNTGPGDKPQRVRLPPRSRGGEDGSIVQVKGNLGLNLLIDKLDRAHAPYLLRASLIPEGADANIANNTVVKTFNVPSQLRAGAPHFREFSFHNDRKEPVEFTLELGSSPLPKDWRVAASFEPGGKVRLAPGETLHGYLTVVTSKSPAEGEHVDVRVAAQDVKSGAPVFQYEWYAVYDVTAPRVTDVKPELREGTGEILLAATVDDGSSMLKEASGVRVEYSTDGGVTFSSRIMAYAAGNFVGPTSFNTALGPFAPGTTVQGTVIASDIAGNRMEVPLKPVTVPAPPTAKHAAQEQD